MSWIEYKNNLGEVIQAEYPLVQTDKLNYMRIARLDSGFWEVSIYWLGIHTENMYVKGLSAAKAVAVEMLLAQWQSVSDGMNKTLDKLR